jgi:hypothetical protein
VSEYVTLMGAEDVRRAGNEMSAAAEQIQRAASTMDSAIERLIRHLEDHAMRVCDALEVKPAPAPRRVECFERFHIRGSEWSPIQSVGYGAFIKWTEEQHGETVAMVEMADGTVKTFQPERIKFEVSA